jgi:ABC-2 type transport system permease protein
MSVFLLLFRWEMFEFFWNRTLIFWNIIFPLVMFLVLVNAFGGPASLGTVTIDFRDGDRTAASSLYRDVLSTAFANNEAVAARFESANAHADLVITVPSGFEAALKGGDPASVTIGYDGSQGLAQRTANEIIRGVTIEFELRTAAGHRALRLDSIDRAHGEKGVPYAAYLASGIVIMTLLSICIMGAVVPLVSRRESNVLRTFQTMPVSRQTYMAAFVCSRLAMSLVFFLVFLPIISLLYHLHMALDAPRLMAASVLVLFVAAVFSLLGVAMTGRMRSIGGANAIANIVFFPLIFLGNLTIPVQGFPPLLQKIAAYLPSALASSALRGIVIHGQIPAFNSVSVLGLIVWGLLSAIAARALFVWDRRQPVKQ